LLTAALASSFSGLFAAPAAAQADFCTRKQPDERCRRNRDCCSGRCRIKKDKKKGRCRCSQLRKPCFDNFDCCGDITGLAGSIVCSDHPDFSQIVCCVSVTGPCQSIADCCSDLACIDEKCATPDT
jgi:hypothetical protein